MEMHQHRLLTRLVALLLCFSLLMPQSAMAGHRWGIPHVPNPIKAVAKAAKQAVRAVVHNSVVRRVSRSVCDTNPRACAVVKAASVGVRMAVQAMQRNFKPTQWRDSVGERVRAEGKRVTGTAVRVRNSHDALAKRSRERLGQGWNRAFDATRKSITVLNTLKVKMLKTSLYCLGVIPGPWGVGALVSAELVGVGQGVMAADDRPSGGVIAAGTVAGGTAVVAARRSDKVAAATEKLKAAKERLRGTAAAEKLKAFSATKKGKGLKYAGKGLKYAAGPGYAAFQCGTGLYGLNKDYRAGLAKEYAKAPGRATRHLSPVYQKRAVGVPGGGQSASKTSVRVAKVPGG